MLINIYQVASANLIQTLETPADRSDRLGLTGVSFLDSLKYNASTGYDYLTRPDSGAGIGGGADLPGSFVSAQYPFNTNTGGISGGAELPLPNYLNRLPASNLPDGGTDATSLTDIKNELIQSRKQNKKDNEVLITKLTDKIIAGYNSAERQEQRITATGPPSGNDRYGVNGSRFQILNDI